MAWWVWWGRRRVGQVSRRDRRALTSPGTAMRSRRDKGTDDAPVEDLVVGVLHGVEDAAVEQERRADAVAARRVQQVDAGARLLVEPPGAGDLEPQQLDDVRRRRSRRQVGAGHAEPVEVLLRQVDAAAAQVLGDVADEVGELEGLAEGARVRPAARSSSGSRIGTICSPMTAAEPCM